MKLKGELSALAAVAAIACAGMPVAAQDTKWDAIISNSNWYVGVPNLTAYVAGNRSASIDPLVIGDQTLWAIGTASHGVFSGQTQASFETKTSNIPPALTTMQGVVTESGQIRINFGSSAAGPIIGIGQMRTLEGGTTSMEMQFTTGSTVLIAHWAYMLPYNPATFTPPAPQQFLPSPNTSPQWSWTAGTTWRLTSQALFGTSQPGTFKIQDYNAGYYWGIGAAPVGNPVGNFTFLGSMTPEGNVIFNVFGGGDAFTSLTGQIVGGPATGMMELRQYTGTSGPVGSPSNAGIMPVSDIAAGQTYFLSNVGTTVIPAFAGGTLQVDVNGLVSSQNFTVDGSSTNRLDQRGNSAVLTGVLSDATPGVPGRITIANSAIGGRIVLGGANSYSGPTTIESNATLVVNGSIVSPLTVQGTLRGTGAVNGAVNIVAGGTLAPGGSPGTLTIAAPVTMPSGSTFAVDIDGTGTGTGAGNYSRLLVSGASNSFTAGGTLRPVMRDIEGNASNSFTPSIGQQFTVVSAQGGVQGSFAAVAQPAGMPSGTRFDVLYAPSTVTLAVTPAFYGNLGLAGLPQTVSEAAVGRALDSMRPAAGQPLSGFASTLFAPLYNLPGEAIPLALEQLSPSLYGDIMLSARMGFYGFAEQVTQRLGSRRSVQNMPGASLSMASACGQTCGGAGPSTVPSSLGTTAWFSAVGQWAEVNSGAAAGFQTSLVGAMAGLDATLAPGLVGGFAIGGGSANTYSWNGANGLGQALQVALYGEYGMGPFFVGGQVAYSRLGQSTTRPLGAWNSVARGNLTSSGFGGQLGVGARLAWADWWFEPTLSVGVLGLTAPSFVEQDPNGLAQRIYGQSLTSVRGGIAVPVGRTISLAPDRPLWLRGLVGWTHEFADIAATTPAAFVQAPAAPFTATSASISRDSLLLGLSAELGLADGVGIFAGWQAALGGPSSVQSARVGVRLTF